MIWRVPVGGIGGVEGRTRGSGLAAGCVRWEPGGGGNAAGAGQKARANMAGEEMWEIGLGFQYAYIGS